jgi:hypothetical protein
MKMTERIDNEGATGANETMNDGEIEQLANELLGCPEGESSRETLQEKLLAALDGPFRTLRDDIHIAPHTVLVFTEGADGKPDTVEAVDLCELPLRYPVTGRHARWCAENLGELVASKALLYRQSRLAQELAEEDPEAEPVCGVPVLAVPVGPGTYYWFDVRARVDPALNR